MDAIKFTIRLILNAFILSLVYKETGIWTVIVFSLLYVNNEINVFINKKQKLIKSWKKKAEKFSFEYKKKKYIYSFSKEGKGVGAIIKFFDEKKLYKGTLIFHEQNDWQCCDSSQIKDDDEWVIYVDNVLDQARKLYPQG